MPSILILADDLSGAADCGVACVQAGLTATVTLGPPIWGMTADAISIDANTRALNADSAAERMQQLVQTYAHDPALLLFKKIDSTLRGNLSSELSAVLRARRITVPGAVAIVAPAFPANGRTTVKGTHYVYGKPVHETETWKRENISGEAYIPDLLKPSGLRCTHLDIELVRSSRTAFVCAIYDAIDFTDVIVCDAATDEDLEAVVAAAAYFQDRVVWVGSAGLASHLPKATGLLRNDKDKGEVASLPKTTGSVLFVMGTISLTTRQQVNALLSSSGIQCIVVPPEVLLEEPRASERERYISQLRQALKLKDCVILVCGSEPLVDPIDRPHLSFALAEMVAAVHNQVGALVVSGGETARSVLDRLGVVTLQLYGELESGVVISSAILDRLRPFTVITKAGDFGRKDTLLNCWDWLQQRGASR